MEPMTHASNYLFTSTRMGFRNWLDRDIELLHAINSDPEVMRFFPAMPTLEQTAAFLVRMQTQFEERGFCYFAVEKLIDQSFIGFIGLSYQSYEAAFTPCVDIGWRLKRSEWNQGFATEGAKKCLEYAQENLQLTQIFSVAPKINVKSERVMQQIGLKKLMEFEHPLLSDFEALKTCVVYSNQEKLDSTEDLHLPSF